MRVHATSLRLFSRLKSLGVRLASDRRGVAAIEFAFLAPVLLALYFVTLEVALGIEANKKVGRVASMVADLVTQAGGEIKQNDVKAIMEIGESILQPYNRTRPKIVVTAIRITDEPGSKVEVAWSQKLVAGAASRDANPGTLTTVPAKLNVPGSFLVRVDAYLDYRPIITWTASQSQKQALGLTAILDPINMRETYYLRPRMSHEVNCIGC